MRTESLLGGETIQVIGLGTWQFGGGMSVDRRYDKEQISTLRAGFEMGYTHIDTAEMYGAGHTEDLVGEALRGFKREEFFMTTKVSPENLRTADVQKSLDGSLKRLRLDYVDLYLIHWPNRRIPLEETFRGLNEMVRRGKTRYLGVSNFNLEQLKEAQVVSETPIVTNQIPFSLRSREYAMNGVVNYCQEQGILITAYSPIKSVNLNDRLIGEVGRRYGASPAQTALSWVVSQPKVITIPKSSNRGRLKENLDSQDIRLTPQDLSLLEAHFA